ncbi:MAG: peptidoglycan DD-metalloendopeptidase family protein [Anaerolineales bacterium]|nr:peptidoglycan DD-metalloendopeptidase family protein [Anaerolineales bacterium]
MPKRVTSLVRFLVFLSVLSLATKSEALVLASSAASNVPATDQVLTTSMGIPSLMPPDSPRQEQITVDSTVPIAAEMANALVVAAQSELKDQTVTHLLVASLDWYGDRALATLIINPSESAKEGSLAFIERSTTVAIDHLGGGWHASFEGSADYKSIVSAIPDSLIVPEAKEALLVGGEGVVNTPSIPTSLKLPWAAGQTWVLMRNPPLHDNSIDFAPPHAIDEDERYVLAAAGGTIIRRCGTATNQAWVVVRHPSSDPTDYWTGYLHLDLSTTRLTVGTQVAQGQLLGITYNSGGSDQCGISSSGPHVHFSVGHIATGSNDASQLVSESIVGTSISGWLVDSRGCLTKPNELDKCGNSSIGSDNNLRTGEVGGTVRNQQDQLVANASVKLVGSGYDKTTQTNGSGVYSFGIVPSGPATVIAWSGSYYGSAAIIVPAFQSQVIPPIILEPIACIPPGNLAQGTLAAASTDDCVPVNRDDAAFVSHVTVPAQTVLPGGTATTKTWRVQNTGTTTWGSDYRLVYVDGNRMNAASPVSVPSTAPNATADLSINLTVPSSTGEHAGYWQLRNPQGIFFGPRLEVRISVPGTSTHITELSFSPGSPSNANPVRVHVLVQGLPNFRAARLKIDGQQVYEIGAPEFYWDWNTSGYSAGSHAVVVEATDWSDLNWTRPERRGASYTINGPPAPANHAPNRPILVANPTYDWYATIGSPPQLCAQAQGDPDGDAITGYQFEASGPSGTYNSSWIGGSCHTFSSVNPGTYEFKAKVRDSHNAESGWSDIWHFTVEPTGVTISDVHFEANTSSEEVKIFACTTGHGGVNITLRVLVNQANDGSTTGPWDIVKEQGSPCFNAIDVPIWRTLRYATGTHAVRVLAWAVQPDAGDVWNGSYALPDRKPAPPHLQAPIDAVQGAAGKVWLNSQTVTFRWDSDMLNGYPTRAASQRLVVSTNSDPTISPVVDYSGLSPSVVSQVVTLASAYPDLYWGVYATNALGTSNTIGHFGIDVADPSCTVQALPDVQYENSFPVYWDGTDDRSGVALYDVQYRDNQRGAWLDWQIGVPVSKTFDLFIGQNGHLYEFRCRAHDAAGNFPFDFPGTAQAETQVDPTARPDNPWWNAAWSTSRNIVLLNNVPAATMPAEYPVHLHFDSGTTPTAAELYAASQSAVKCNDLRVVQNNATELHRLIPTCSSSAIDIYFRAKVAIGGGGTDSTTHQLYYGNPGAASPQADPNQVWFPFDESDSTNLYFFQEGTSTTANDSSGNGRNCSIDSSVQWAPAKWGWGLRFNRSNAGDSRSLNCGSVPSLGAFTIEFWYNPDSDGDGRIAGALSGGGNGGGGNNWLLQAFEKRIRLDVWPCGPCGSSEVRSNFQMDQAPYLGHWNHIAVTFNGGNEVKFWINGQLDSAKTLGQSGINTFSPPLEIGSVEGNGQIKANLGALRISSGVKTSFPYGAFGAITSEPSAAVGGPIYPPAAGSAELEIVSLTAEPYLDGAVLVRAVVQNSGNLPTENGFSTDVYLDHVPAGARDYTGSVNFWNASSIGPGEIVTLTTLLEGPAALAMHGLQTTAEVHYTLYGQVDSAGSVSESSEGDNIQLSGDSVCFPASDPYENDGSPGQAMAIGIGATQTHNFQAPGDEDWVKFTAQAGITYTLSTSGLGALADTYLQLYAPDGVTPLAADDDSGPGLASALTWPITQAGTYYIRIRHWSQQAGGCDTGYSVSVTLAEGTPRYLYFPLIHR